MNHRARAEISQVLRDLLKSPWMWATAAVILLQPVLHPLLIYFFLRSVIVVASEWIPCVAIALLALLSFLAWSLWIRGAIIAAHAKRNGLLYRLDHRWLGVAHISLILIIAPTVAITLTQGMRDIGKPGHLVTREAQLDHILGPSPIKFAQRFWTENSGDR